MSDDGEGGGQESEGPSLANLWGTAAGAGDYGDHKGQADAYQTAIHDAPDAFSGQNYFPDDMDRQNLYRPKDTGFEREIQKRLDAAYICGPHR